MPPTAWAVDTAPPNPGTAPGNAPEHPGGRHRTAEPVGPHRETPRNIRAVDTGTVLDRLQLPTTVPTRAGDLTVRRARRDDVGAVLELLADDEITVQRGDVAQPQDEPVYRAAMARILDDPGNDLVVAERSGRVVGTLQLTLIPGLARRGSLRLLVEAVRVSSAERSAGIGTALLRWVMDDATAQLDAEQVQLTSSAARTDARRFYRRLGFVDSHVGFKYRVPPSGR